MLKRTVGVRHMGSGPKSQLRHFSANIGKITQLQFPACEARVVTAVMEDANALH